MVINFDSLITEICGQGLLYSAIPCYSTGVTINMLPHLHLLELKVFYG